jgi:hypothetical protein
LTGNGLRAVAPLGTVYLLIADDCCSFEPGSTVDTYHEGDERVANRLQEVAMFQNAAVDVAIAWH